MARGLPPRAVIGSAHLAKCVVSIAASISFLLTIGASHLSAVAGLDWMFGDQSINVIDKENWAQLDGEYALDAGAFTTLKFGARRNTHERSLNGIVNQRPALDGSAFNTANWPQGISNYPSNFGSGLGSGFPTSVWYYTAAQLAAFSSKVAYRPTDGSREPYSEEYGVKETNSAAYLQANFEGKGWSGNAHWKKNASC